MLILGIETATLQVGCAVGGHEGVLASFHAAKGRRHVETLVPALEFVCRQARIDLSEISAIAVDVGPGLFSGLRVGVATAKAMALALRIPTVGVASLDLLALPVRYSNRLIVAVIDARRGELFYAFYRQVPGGVQRLSAYQLGTADDLASELLARGDDCLLVGDGAVRYQEILGEVARSEVADVDNAYPSASSLVELAHPRAIREQF
ncbi:MAG: tRNA threonylcarbamoyladenosine biosynthesis protein TsaB, partial [Actinomycetota bacterium]|nr:tRNA threonylcarbamoyladenosine biosynthesis protein TsaB [Actinomycetota bacterium]